MTRFQLLIAVAISHVIFLTFIAVVVGEEEATGEFNHPMSLQFIGVADGKSYFADVNQTLNRSASAAYCHEARLKLASIETQEQADMLNKMLPELGFGSEYFWTSGKETRKDSMFMWNETETQVDSSLVVGWGYSTAESSCIVYYAHSTNSHFYAYPCTILNRPLCQS